MKGSPMNRYKRLPYAFVLIAGCGGMPTTPMSPPAATQVSTESPKKDVTAGTCRQQYNTLLSESKKEAEKLAMKANKTAELMTLTTAIAYPDNAYVTLLKEALKNGVLLSTTQVSIEHATLGDVRKTIELIHQASAMNGVTLDIFLEEIRSSHPNATLEAVAAQINLGVESTFCNGQKFFSYEDILAFVRRNLPAS